jgi:transposase-like protein
MCITNNEDIILLEPINQKPKPRRRKRFTIKEKFAIVQDLKARKCSIEEIAAIYNTGKRNVFRWKALYARYNDLREFYGTASM